jgi:GNAT superfamily N-acetyltransferase
MADSDRNFVRSAWLKSYRALCEWAPREEYFALHHDVVEGLVERATARTVVACDKDDEDNLLGFACGEPHQTRPLLHWCYVKSAFRHHGIARAMVDSVLDGSGSPERIVRTMTHQPPGSVSAKLRAAGWAIHPTLSFYLALEREKEAA